MRTGVAYKEFNGYQDVFYAACEIPFAPVVTVNSFSMLAGDTQIVNLPSRCNDFGNGNDEVTFSSGLPSFVTYDRTTMTLIVEPVSSDEGVYTVFWAANAIPNDPNISG